MFNLQNLEDEEAEINIFDLPRPLYSEKLQLSLRKSLERNSSTVIFNLHSLTTFILSSVTYPTSWQSFR